MFAALPDTNVWTFQARVNEATLKDRTECKRADVPICKDQRELRPCLCPTTSVLRKDEQTWCNDPDNRHEQTARTEGMVWNNIILYFQQFTKSCREKAFLQPHRGRAFTRGTHREHKDLSPSETVPSWCGCWRPEDQCGSLWVQGLEGSKHWG